MECKGQCFAAVWQKKSALLFTGIIVNILTLTYK